MSRAGLRIIAGELRGRRIPVPPGDVRPTGERAREALFAILADRVVDARVLDAYSGSGALGFEAISRGAAELVLAEADRRVLTVPACHRLRAWGSSSAAGSYAWPGGGGV